MTDNTYNGWTNYETWRVRLEMFDGDYCSDNDLDAYDLGQHLREMAAETIDAQSEGWARDYARAFLDAVNWREIAEHMIEDYRPAVELCRNGVALADCDCC
jgi:kynureninase